MLNPSLGGLAAAHLDDAQQHRDFEVDEMLQDCGPSLRRNACNIGACGWDLGLVELHRRHLLQVLCVVTATMSHVHTIGDAERCSASIVAGVLAVHAIHTSGDESVTACNACIFAPDEVSFLTSNVRTILTLSLG